MKIAKSRRTKQCAALKNVFTALHFICLFGPLAWYVPYGYATGTPVEKIGMSSTVIVAIVLAAISTIVGATSKAGLHRCMLWILITGVLITLSEIETFIYIMALTSILDELVFCKLKDHYKAAYVANREIDRRMQ